MTKEKEVTLEIRQAESADAALVVDFLNRVGKESDYMTLDEAGIGMSPADMENFLTVQEMADNRICLLLFLDQELAALLNITAASQRSIQHIGDVFIVVQKAYWNQGLGQIKVSRLDISYRFSSLDLSLIRERRIQIKALLTSRQAQEECCASYG